MNMEQTPKKQNEKGGLTLQEQLEAELQRYQAAVRAVGYTVFEWDIEEGTVIYSGEWTTEFRFASLCDEVDGKRIAASPIPEVHPEDQPLLLSQALLVLAGEQIFTAEVRAAKTDGEYLWLRIYGSVQKTIRGVPEKVIGFIMNIDEEKRSSLELMEMAQRDALTGLLNRKASQAQIEAYLAEESDDNCAMIIIDIDDFKSINDRFGHLFGDMVLTRTAAEIGKLFRSHDVVGRIGGDEFMVFLKNIPQQSLVEDRCNRLCATARRLSDELFSGTVFSVSVGAFFAPKRGGRFTDLYQKADSAMYHAKSLGKNRYVMEAAPAEE